MSIYDPSDDDSLDAQVYEVVVRIKIRHDANIQQVVEDMDYSFDHEDIVSTEIVEIIDDVLK